MNENPLLVTDGQYIFAHVGGKSYGPFVAALTPDGQIKDVIANSNCPQGVPFNPKHCKGGKIHRVTNPIFPPTS